VKGITLRTLLFGVLATAAIALCVRLGFWQLDRLEQRRARNATVQAKAKLPAASVGELRGGDSASIHFRHVKLRGIPDYEREVVLAARSQAGAPGVQLLTPVRPVDGSFGDTAILLLRGFVYAADGIEFDKVAAREGDTLDIDGLVTFFPPKRPGNVRLTSTPTAIRYLDRDTIETMIGRPVEPYLLLALGDTVPKSMTSPARVPPPSLGEGPHFSYAMQWFGFATVFAVGFVAFVMNSRKERDTEV
jgi:surfeit locus 1 family protein